MRRGLQKPRKKYWCPICDCDFVEEGHKCRSCGKKIKVLNRQYKSKDEEASL